MGGRFAKPSEPELTMEEVQKHCTKDDAWIILFGEAIDVTNYLPIHPGGEDMLAAYLGKDATSDWEQIHKLDTLEQQMQHLCKMGRVAAPESLLSWLWKRIRKEQPASSPLLLGGAPAAVSDTSPAGAPEVEPKKWNAEAEAELPPGGVFDLSELARWDGIELPMCIGVCGIVLDVSSSSNFVPNFGYGKLWAGRDTTYAMATVSLKPYDANKFDFQLDELGPEQSKALAGWFKHFTTKYRQVGTLKDLDSWDFSSVRTMAAELPGTSMSSPADEANAFKGQQAPANTASF